MDKSNVSNYGKAANVGVNHIQHQQNHLTPDAKSVDMKSSNTCQPMINFIQVLDRDSNNQVIRSPWPQNDAARWAQMEFGRDSQKVIWSNLLQDFTSPNNAEFEVDHM
jgi:hypothetical protein